MLVGRSDVMQQLRAQIARIGRTHFTVLIEGESGSGKELVAREIHAHSARQRGPFVAVNCAAIVETLVEAELFGIEERTATGVRGRRGKFELADQGTIFLDEVGDLSSTAQAKLLRILQDMTVERVGSSGAQSIDTRVLAATNRNLHQMVSAGQFRADLYYRLSGVDVTVPPLRERRGDIPLLIDHFLHLHGGSSPPRITDSAKEALIVYDWPGNVRQLGRMLERAVALRSGPAIALNDLPDTVRQAYGEIMASGPDRDDSLRGWCSRYVRLVLERCGGNKRRACTVLRISYHTLQAHLEYSRRAVPATSDGLDATTPPACDAAP